jgi:hypothetical protein
MRRDGIGRRNSEMKIKKREGEGQKHREMTTQNSKIKMCQK